MNADNASAGCNMQMAMKLAAAEVGSKIVKIATKTLCCAASISR